MRCLSKEAILVLTRLQETIPKVCLDGKIVGHTRDGARSRPLTDAQKAAQPRELAFFKGINDARDGKGGLSATMTGGLPAGNYRVCTLGSSSNHQPVLMPVAQRGAQGDCQKFVVQ